MSIGAPSLNTSQHQLPNGAPFPATAANNGLSVDPGTGKIVLGNNLASVLAQLTSDRQIPLNGNSLFLTSTRDAPFPDFIVFSDAPAGAWVNIAGGAGKAQLLVADEQANRGLVVDSGGASWGIGDLDSLAGGAFLEIAGDVLSLFSNSNRGLLLDDTNQQAFFGDVGGGSNGNVISLDWSGTGGMTFGDGNGRYLVLDDTAVMRFEMGDVDNSQNGNKIQVDDPNSRFSVFTFGTARMLDLDRVNQLYRMGDVSGATGNGTQIEIDDSAQIITLNASSGIETQNPLSGAGTWKLGEYIAAPVAFDPLNFVEISINGTVVKLATCT